jgi:site-specific DNA recombinase
MGSDRRAKDRPSFTVKRDGSRYPCYVSRALLQNRRELAGSLARVPADVVERVVVEHTNDLLS